jgi:catechol-2,3-dioxygenase
MEIKLLEHINLQTADMDRLEKWYIQILGLEKGYRPPFDVSGTWLYSGDVPMVHLLEVKETPHVTEPRIEHFCMRASGLKTLLARLESEDIPSRILRVPELRILQVYLTDPDGNNMHIDFPPEEGDAAGFA